MMRIIITIFISILLISCNKGEKEVIIVPKNYNGYIIILFEQSNGSPKKMQDGKRIYNIPSNGILKTQFTWNEGFHEFPEYFFESVSPANSIPSFVEFSKIPENKLVGFMGAGGSANKDHAGKETVPFAIYYVGVKDSIKIAMEHVEKIDIAALAQ